MSSYLASVSRAGVESDDRHAEPRSARGARGLDRGRDAGNTGLGRAGGHDHGSADDALQLGRRARRRPQNRDGERDGAQLRPA